MQVERIHVSTGATQLRMLRNSRPQTGLEAKFSMQFAMAAALVARKVGLAELTDGFVQRPEVQAIFPRVSLYGYRRQQCRAPLSRPPTPSKSRPRAARRLNSGPVEYAKGSHQRPLSREELWDKFADCLGADFQEAKKSRAFENLMMFDRLNSAGDLAMKN